MSRIRAGHLPLRLQTVDLAATLSTVAEGRDHPQDRHRLVLDLQDEPTYVGLTSTASTDRH